MVDDDEDDVVEIQPQRWSWLRLGVIAANAARNAARVVESTLGEITDAMHRHDLWRDERRDFHEAMTRDLESIPVVSE